MATTVVTGVDNRLSPSELEDLHIRLATALSLNDPNINTESIVSDILSGREDPVPLYTPTTIEADDQIRQQISENSPVVWDSIFKVIENGQIDALDHFVKLGLDVNSPHPTRQQYLIYHAVEYSQTNMMRHLINLHADVNVWSGHPRFHFSNMIDRERVRTPLMCAAEKGNLNICKILCESAFADPMLIAPDGQTAQRLAARNGHKEVVQYLPAHRGGAFRRLKCMALERFLAQDR
jgi:ankyrin repeat protein